MRIPTMLAILAGVILLTLAPASAAEPASADDTARLLAGLPPSAASPLTPLTQDAAWQRHQRFFDSAFAQLEQRQLSKIHAWADANLAAPRPAMFYFFSGPDFLYADAFYSKATTYIMAALEPTGPIPDLTRLPRAGIGPSLSYVERSLQSILSFSFFKTKDMKTDLNEGAINGTLPILYVFLARTGKTIRSVGLVWLDANGVLHEAGEPPPSNATRGARIVFGGADGAEKTLYYFSTDLSNSGVTSSGFLKFCATVAPGNSLLKSASYLLRSSHFSTVRSFLLNNSTTIIQDDSGIPLAAYDSKAWRFFPFGRYAGPIEKFPSMYQQGYAKLFERAQPLDFGIGYRWRTQESNLLLSIRLPAGDASASAEAAIPPETDEPPQRARHAPRTPAPLWPPRPSNGYWFLPRW
ncbi:MAG: hypothetical protein WA702_10445 [Bradyrhizobium sp.]|jgi:hypothetical protein|uniref:hypothetical protein n=1 Tax=Bradyrhizobium sp. TaxID=376 RepID=UPI003C7CDBBC